jgi:hypothetical protein
MSKFCKRGLQILSSQQEIITAQEVQVPLLPKRLWMCKASGSLAAAVLLLALASEIPAQESKGSSVPAPVLPFYARNKCPFEGCVYREWTALKDIPVYDAWREAPHLTGTLRKGEKVTALGGIVITYRPGVIHVDRDIPAAGLKRGDIILTYTLLGEGFSQVWLNGRFYEDFDISFTKWPDGSGCGGAHCAATYADLGKKAWWAEIKLKSGATVWVDMESASFDGVDLLASVDVLKRAF